MLRSSPGKDEGIGTVVLAVMNEDGGAIVAMWSHERLTSNGDNEGNLRIEIWRGEEQKRATRSSCGFVGKHVARQETSLVAAAYSTLQNDLAWEGTSS